MLGSKSKTMVKEKGKVRVLATAVLYNLRSGSW